MAQTPREPKVQILARLSCSWLCAREKAANPQKRKRFSLSAGEDLQIVETQVRDMPYEEFVRHVRSQTYLPRCPKCGTWYGKGYAIAGEVQALQRTVYHCSNCGHNELVRWV